MSEQRQINRDLRGAVRDSRWTLCVFGVQLGVPITEEELGYLPGATTVNGKPCYPETDSGEPKERRITFSYPPVKAATLSLGKCETNPGGECKTCDRCKTFNAAFRSAIAEARKEGSTTWFENMGVRLIQRRLIENTLYGKKRAAAS